MAESVPLTSGRPPNNLPFVLSSFVGRGREISELRRLLLEDYRLLTLTGPGGCGKTRLALAVATEMAEDFEDGAWWVGLASLSGPTLMSQAVAQALRVREAPTRTLLEVLVEHLESMEMLLVLDNCEHLVEGCANIADTLLRACPNLKILATSREALGIVGERVMVVPSLSLPDADEPLPALAGHEAVRLFVDRARAVDSTFRLTEKNAPHVARLCRKLDGIPLALEFAAARARMLSAEQILKRLEDPLKLLTAGGRTADPRHRTLRATLEWSYELFSEPERTLFGRLSVFAGGFTLEAAEAVGAGDDVEEGEVLDLLSGLADKSMVATEPSPGSGDAPRYRMLEPVRQYGLERLEEGGEAETTRRQHARHFLELAEEAEPELRRTRQAEWLERLETEHDNLRAALSWALERREAELGLRLGAALGEFWSLRGYLSEGRRWLEAVLKSGGAPAAARAKVLARLGRITWGQGDYERSVALQEEGLALYRRLGDRVGLAAALRTLGMAEMHRNELGRARTLLEEAVTLERASEDTAGLARSLPMLGLVAVVRHDHERARALCEESLALAREAGDDYAIGFSLVVGALACSGRGDYRRAQALLEEGLELAWRLKIMHLTVVHLHASAALAGLQGQAVRSARLWGAAEALREGLGIHLSPLERSHYAPHIDAARARLGEAWWEAAWAEGRAMAPQQTVEYALGKAPPPANPATASYPAGLSAREAEVLRLVAKGLTNAGVAKELFISPRTVNRHLNSIYAKLGKSSRQGAARFAIDHGLL
ncbi:MAG: LuxR C-terminal-related transcriptional regulator [Actinomycetota bacterium]|nr:LuxR C-terminal-related transcriptional regulator [Actinomycetota bacterium]